MSLIEENYHASTIRPLLVLNKDTKSNLFIIQSLSTCHHPVDLELPLVAHRLVERVSFLILRAIVKKCILSSTWAVGFIFM